MSGINVSTELIKPFRHLYFHDEMERFRRHHEAIRKQYEGRFVGLRDGRVLDHDADGNQLYTRLRQKYDDLPVLIVQVTDQPEQIFTRLGQRIAS